MSTPRELTSFALIGVASNAVLYAMYLALTAGGLGHKTAMSVAFVAGVLWSYWFNRVWTFRHTGALTCSALRYAGTYAIAYAANVGALVVLVDIAHLAHETVMLALIVATAGLTFVLQKTWVFRSARASQ